MYDNIDVAEWPGLDEGTKALLLGAYVQTLKGFVHMVRDEEGIEALLARGLTEERIASLRTDALSHLDALPEAVIRGVLDPFFETGSEGIVWSVYEDGKTGYEGLHQLGGGEYLRVVGHDGETLFEGRIEPDDKNGWREYPGRPGDGYGQPVALGMWVHWIQAGWQPDDWARLFFHDGDAYRAVLTYNRKRN